MVNLTEQIRRRVESKLAKKANRDKAKLAAKLRDPNMRKKLLAKAIIMDNVGNE
jgi:hypothetical protein